MRGILVVSDGSTGSARAIARASRLAATACVPLFLAHATNAAPPAAAPERERTAGARVACSIEDLGAEVIARNAPVDSIPSLAARAGADLIVLGASPASDPHASPLAARVAAAAAASVLLIVREPAGDYAAVVAGVDFSPNARRALALARALAPAAEISALHAFHADLAAPGRPAPDRAAADAVADALARSSAAELEAFLLGLGPGGARLLARAVGGRPAPALRREVIARGADLLALGAHGGGGAALGSLAAEMLAAPPCDVLVARATG